jgi:pimeloyl-ACP methyl ester carboxylesterase
MGWRARTAAAVVVLAAVACGCGGGDHHAASVTAADTTPAPAPTPRRATAPDPLDHCDSAGAGWRTLDAAGATGAPAARLGSGRVGIVFANDSINDVCSWSAEARALAARGHPVAVFKASRGLEVDQAVTVGAALRAADAGARRVVLIGASVGARAVLQAALEHPRGVVGLVALSAERRVTTSPGDLLADVRHVRLPVLSIGSRGDPLTSYGRDTRAFHRALANDTTLLVSGSDHGVELLAGRHAPQVRAAILRFVGSL